MINTKNFNLNRDIYNALTMCNNVLAESKNYTEDEVKKRMQALVKNIETHSQKIIPLDEVAGSEGSSQTAFELRLLAATVVCEDITRRFNKCINVFIFARKHGFKGICDAERNMKEIDDHYRMLEDIAYGRATKESIKELGDYIIRLQGKKIRGILGIITGMIIRIDILLGLIIAGKILFKM